MRLPASDSPSVPAPPAPVQARRYFPTGLPAVATFVCLLFTTFLHAAPPRPPVLDHTLPAATHEQLEAATREILALPTADLLALVPVQTPFITSDCPACGHAGYTRGLDRNQWKFSLPDRLTCVKCTATFPSEKYPLNHRETFLNTVGEKVEIAFHRDATGARHALPGAIHSAQHGWLAQNLIALARLYQLTGDDRYAHRVVLVLERYAQVFPHYLVKDFLQPKSTEPGFVGKAKPTYVYVSTGGPWMRDGRRYAEKPSEPAASEKRTNTPYGWTQSRWGWSRWGNEFPDELLVAYDLLQSSDAFEKISAARGADVRRHILEDLFGNAIAFLQAFPFYYHLHNNASGQIADIIRAGRVLGRPDWVHYGYRWSRDVLEQYAFSRDGAFAESPGYLYVFLASQEANFTALNGYSDPPGYVSPNGLRLDNLGASGALAFLQKSQSAVARTLFPNGSLLPLGDNRHDDFADPLAWPANGRAALTRSQNVLLPGYGHAVLGDGAGDRQVQAHLQFSKFTDVVHTHLDGLSLMLWAFGSEFFTDVGYHKTKYRGYATTTLSHNTVVIDRAPQKGAEPKGSVLLYEPNLPGVSLVQVEAAGAYEGRASRYRRTLLLNTRDPAAPYLVDVFEVRGGRTHDYVLHGPTIFDSTAETALPLAPLPGERPLLAPGERWSDDTAKVPYGVFTRVRHAAADPDFSVTFKLVNPFERPEFFPNERYPARPTFHYAAAPAAYRDRLELGVRTHFPAGAGSRELYLADSPSLTRTGLEGSALTEKLKRPSLLLRRTGTDGLTSVFVAVHEPYYGRPKINAVRRLPLQNARDTGVALEIETANGTDLVLLTLDGHAPLRTTTATLAGRAGLISTPRSRQPAAYLIGGTELTSGALRLTSPTARHTGLIRSVTSQWDGAPANAFVTTTVLPGGETLRGSWLLAELGSGGTTEAFEVDHVATRDGQTWIYLTDDPGLRKKGDTIAETFFPRRTFTGEIRFTIHTRATTP